MPINFITTGTTTVNATADNQFWLLTAGESRDTSGLPGFSTDGYSNITLSVAGNLIGSPALGVNSLSENFTLLIEETGTLGSVVSAASGATFINDGTISAVTGFQTLFASTDNNFVNNGTITGSSLAVKIVGSGHTFTNTNTVESTGTYGFLLLGNSTEGNTVVNSGSISGDTYGMAFVNTDGPNSVFNSGVIFATSGPRAIQGDDARQNIFNTGTIDGKVFLEGGNDFFDSRNGTFTGKADGGAGNDSILTGTGKQNLVGGDGADLLDAGTGNDVLTGGAQGDVMIGRKGDDKLFGNGGNDILRGGTGDDLLKGGNGSDVLNGGRGSDIMIGGGGADVFKFGVNEANDVVRDYVDGTDLIDLTALGLADFAALAGAISDDGADALIDISAVGDFGTVRVEGAAGLLDAGDFIL